jgi:hypothetical protein
MQHDTEDRKHSGPSAGRLANAGFVLVEVTFPLRQGWFGRGGGPAGAGCLS